MDETVQQMSSRSDFMRTAVLLTTSIVLTGGNIQMILPVSFSRCLVVLRSCHWLLLLIWQRRVAYPVLYAGSAGQSAGCERLPAVRVGPRQEGISADRSARAARHSYWD